MDDLYKFEDLNSNLYTIAIIIGINNYKESSIPKLDYAVNDAKKFSELCTKYGVNEVFTLLDENAERKSILKLIGKTIPLIFQKHNCRRKIIFFFSGHGYNDIESNLPKATLLTYDTDPSDKVNFSLNLDSLIGAISRSTPNEVFIFIDACSVDFNNNLTDIVKSIFKDAGRILKNEDTKHFFAYFACPNGNALEDKENQMGFFTNSLIKNIEKIQKHGGNLSDLIERIHDDFSEDSVMNPQYISIGNEQTWLFTKRLEHKFEKLAVNRNAQHFLVARDLIQSALSTCISNAQSHILIFGKSGVGKTTIIQMYIKESAPTSIYLSLFKEKSANNLQGLVNSLVEKAVDVFPNGQPLESIDSTLKYFKAHSKSTLIFVDHIERNLLAAQNLSEILRQYDIKAVFIGRDKSFEYDELTTFEIPKLTIDEIREYLKINEISLGAEDLLIQSQGLPLMLNSILFGGIEKFDCEKIEYFKAVLEATGGYIDERTFKCIFKIDSSLIDHFIKLGMIKFQDNKYIPHDSIITSSAGVDSQIVMNFLEVQVIQFPNDFWACKKLVTFVIHANHENIFVNSQNDSALMIATNKLIIMREWLLIDQLSQSLICNDSNQISTLLVIAKAYAHQSNFQKVNELKIYFERKILSEDEENKLSLVLAESFWWKGDYINTRKMCQLVLSCNPKGKVLAECNLQMGIADFFEGNWESALSNFSFANDIYSDADAQTIGWALYLSGTILALTGSNINKGKDLMFSGIRLLEHIGDDVGYAIAWGNLAEISWKLRDYSSALLQSKKALDISISTNNIINQIENKRNMLHIYIRTLNVYSNKITNLISELKEFVESNASIMEKMQVYNTLSSAFLYRNKSSLAYEMIKNVENYTMGNREYHIYTVSNKCLLYMLNNNFIKAKSAYIEAFNIAKAGDNYLAIRQLNDDIEFLHEKYTSKTSVKLYDYIMQNTKETEEILMRKETTDEDFN